MPTKYTFGPFEFDPASGSLRKHGVRLKLQRQPSQILQALLEDPGKTVSRSGLRARLWPENTFVDFDQGLNVAIRKLRDALGDSADQPCYVATETGIGYRFIAPVVRHNGVPPSEFREMPVPQPAAAPKPDLSWKNWVTVAIPVCTIGVFLVISVLLRFRGDRPGTLQAAIPFPAGVRLVTNGENAGLALSPDGRTVAFSAIGANGQPMLWLRRLDSPAPEPIPGTETGAFPFWSSDGGSLGFFTDLELRRVDLSTGRVSRICNVQSGRGAAWTSGGDIVFAPSTRTAIYKISSNGGGEPIPVTHLDGEKFTTHRWPTLLPDGKHFVYMAARHDKPQPATLFLGSLDGSAERFIAEADTNAIAVPGALLFLSGGKLLVQGFNQSTAALDAGATVVAEGVDYDSGLWLAAFATSGDSLLFRKRPETGSQQTISWFDSHGKWLADAGAPGTYRAVTLAPNGRDVAVLCGDPNVGLCMVGANGAVTNVANTPTIDSPAWSPDSSSLAYSVHDSMGTRTEIKKLTSAEPARVLLRSAGPVSFSPDGWQLLVRRFYEHEGRSALSVLDLRTGVETEYLPPAPGLVRVSGQFSPDGRWVAYSSRESGADAVYVMSFPKPSLKYRASPGYGNSPRWRGDGRELYFLGKDQTIEAVTVSRRGEELVFGAPRALFRAPIFPSPWDLNSWDVIRDGSKFVVNTVRTNDSSLMIVTNWRQMLGMH